MVLRRFLDGRAGWIAYGLFALLTYATRDVQIYNDLFGEHAIFTSIDRSSQLERAIKRQDDRKIIERVYYSSSNKNSYLVRQVLIDDCPEFAITTRVGYGKKEYEDDPLLYDPVSSGFVLKSYGGYEVRVFGNCDPYSRGMLKEHTQEIFYRIREHALNRDN